MTSPCKVLYLTSNLKLLKIGVLLFLLETSGIEAKRFVFSTVSSVRQVQAPFTDCATTGIREKRRSCPVSCHWSKAASTNLWELCLLPPLPLTRTFMLYLFCAESCITMSKGWCVTLPTLEQGVVVTSVHSC